MLNLQSETRFLPQVQDISFNVLAPYAGDSQFLIFDFTQVARYR